MGRPLTAARPGQRVGRLPREHRASAAQSKAGRRAVPLAPRQAVAPRERRRCEVEEDEHGRVPRVKPDEKGRQGHEQADHVMELSGRRGLYPALTGPPGDRCRQARLSSCSSRCAPDRPLAQHGHGQERRRHRHKGPDGRNQISRLAASGCRYRKVDLLAEALQRPPRAR